MTELDFSLPEAFDGNVRLFPLPNLVLFPGALQGLHVFEPRYRVLTKDSLSEDSLITPALWQPFDESHPPPEPVPIFDTVCLGKIVTCAKLRNGCYNLMLLGIRRAKIVRELETGLSYRMAEVTLIDEICGANRATQKKLSQALITAYRQATKAPTEPHIMFEQIDIGKIPLGLVTDTIAFSTKLSSLQRQRLLEIPDAAIRAKIILECLAVAVEQPEGPADPNEFDFPPKFSTN